MSETTTHEIPDGAGWQGLVRHGARRLFLDRQADFWLGELTGTWSLGEVRARIVAIRTETSDTLTFTLRANRHWRGHRAGQYVLLAFEIDGVRMRRCYSISSRPSSGRRFTITVKRQPNGRVSGWLHDRARIGDVVTVDHAAGAFVVEPDDGPLLFVSGGSGITPVHAILADLAGRGRLRDVHVVHYARDPASVILGRELRHLAETHTGVHLHFAYTSGPRGAAHLDTRTLTRLVPDFATRTAFVCGPPSLMSEAERIWTALGRREQLREERFVAAPVTSQAAGAAGAQVTLAASGNVVRLSGEGSLLEELERGGAAPAYGCRMGICKTCTRRKRSGAVLDLRTGRISDAPDEDVQLCVSAARSDLTLDL